ncbi:hypothetical protein [Enterobacter mori]|uniref:hypothetical protein n=1 Tax=Enterobacter mori TaxID=539813 RepID=UPI003D6E5A89
MDSKAPSDSELMEYLRKKYIEEKKKSNPKREGYLAAKYEEPLEVSPEAFFEYMDAKGIPDKCTACGSDSVVIPIGTYTEVDETQDSEGTEPQQKRVKYASFTFLTNSSGETTPSRAYFIRHCGDCGHLDLFRAKNVLEWVREQEDSTSEEESDDQA